MLIPCAYDEVLAKLFSLPTLFTGIVSWCVCGTGVPCVMQKPQQKTGKGKTVLNLESADLGLVLTWPLILQVYQCFSYLSLHYLKT